MEKVTNKPKEKSATDNRKRKFYRWVVHMDQSPDVESRWMENGGEQSELEATEEKARKMYPNDEIVGHHLEWAEK